MPAIQQIKSGQFPKASEWNALAEAYNGGAIGASGPEGIPVARLRGKNTSGSDRSRFDTMAIDGISAALETDGSVDLIFDLVDADSTKPTAVLIDSIEDGQIGNFALDGLALAKVAAGTITHEYATIDAANHRLTPQADESSIRLLAAPDASNEKLLPVLLGSGGGGSGTTAGYARTPSGGIPAASDNGTNLTLGSATCTEMTGSGTTVSPTATTYEVVNMVSKAIAGDVVVGWVMRNGKRVVDVADCAATASPSFGTSQGTASGTLTTAGTTHTVPLPSGIPSGARIITFFAINTSSDNATTPTGFSQYATYAPNSSSRLYVYQRLADGTEGSSIDITTSTSQKSNFATIVLTDAEIVAAATDDSDNTAVMSHGTFVLATPDEDPSQFLMFATWQGTESLSSYPSDYPNDQILEQQTGLSLAVALSNTNNGASSPAGNDFTRASSGSDWQCNAIQLGETP